MSALKPMEIRTGHEGTEEKGIKRLLWRYKYFGLALVPFFLFLVSVDEKSVHTKSNLVCGEECSARREDRYEHFNGRDILDTKHLMDQVADETKLLIKKLKVDYGEETFDKIFMTDDGKVRPFEPYSDKSSERLKRKLMIKVLSVKMDLMRKESSFNGCDCINGDVGVPGSVETKKSSAEDDEDSLPPFDMSYKNYIWATGGHSASAAHGNLYNESYTAFMERDLKDVFGSIGINFEGRNYAMGGTGSAAEIAMCWTEIFGDDVDFFSWDYGMTDVGQPLRFMHYAYRGALSAGRPAFMGIRVNIDRGQQQPLVDVLEKNGVPIFLENDSLWTDMRKEIPDTFGLSEDEINAMPEYVRNYKCNGVIEKGEPFCKIEKYTSYICEDRRGKAPWHPGIKTHAMVGHALSLFLIDSLLAALKDLIELEREGSVQALLSQLWQEEDEVYEHQMTKIDFQEYAQELYSVDEEHQDELFPALFFTGKSMCHTARLPARTRYLGYLTNTDKVGGPMPMGQETYDVGVEQNEVPGDDSAPMQLVWTDDNMHQQDCPVAVNVDHKDSFLSKGNGWHTLVFPNEAERRAYDYNPEELKGNVIIVFTKCDWGDCEEAYLGPKEFKKAWKMKINGSPVTKLLDIGHDAFVAKHNDGFKFLPSVDNDYKFEIKVMGDDESKYVKVSSFIVY